MNIILLSGGSGKRLWPLSNDVPSKQFIKIFKKEDGSYESMVQRIYSQIKTVDKDATVTIATSKSQVSAIHNQLGTEVGISVEPCRRDTFAAIALAAAYLHDVRSVDEDEAVVVCPVDPYVELSYFERVNDLYKAAQSGKKNIYLMGIEPTYPSEKYGYLIPGEDGGVKAFEEKPSRAEAEALIKEGAYWNSGCSVFKLSYILERAHEIIDFSDYRDLYMKYDELNPASFDDAVLARQKKLFMVTFDGEWRDVGTWNMMSEVMDGPVKGNGLLDEECDNTNIINELDVPILGLGLKDLVIAASNDGILVSGKERSGYMMPYVNKIASDGGGRFAEKSWGTYKVIDAQPGGMTIKVDLKAGSSMKYHSREKRDEVWTVVSGKGAAIVDGMEQMIKPGDVISIAAGCKHTVIALTDLHIIETQVGEEVSKSDKNVYEMPEIAMEIISDVR